MVGGRRSVAAPVAQAQCCSNRVNRGCNGRDVQLDRLGEQLAASTRKKKRQFVPEDGLTLEDNALAPIPKKRWSKGSKNLHPAQPQLNPPAVQPLQLPADDGRYGFQPTAISPAPSHPPLPPLRTSTPSHPPPSLQSTPSHTRLPPLQTSTPSHLPLPPLQTSAPSPSPLPSLHASIPYYPPLPPLQASSPPSRTSFSPLHASLPPLHRSLPHLHVSPPRSHQPYQLPADDRYDDGYNGVHASLPHIDDGCYIHPSLSSVPPQLDLSSLPPHKPYVSPPLSHFELHPRSSLLSVPELGEFEDDEEFEGEDQEPEIDEQSEDEDDRQAHVFLRASLDQVSAVTTPQPPAQPVPRVASALAPQPLARASQDHIGFADISTEQSVLGNHYAHNHPPRAPHFQLPPSQPLPQPDTDPDPNPKSRTLDSYPPGWQEVITLAKLMFHAYVAGKCGFPDAIDGVNMAKKCLDNAVTTHRGEGGTLDPRYHVNKNMWMIVFGESWQSRSQLKADIRVQVRNLKTFCPDNGSRQSRSPHEVRASIQQQVSSWMSDGSYLHDTVSNLTEQIHFAHPIIASTCRSFYFDRWSDISTSDRDTFRGSVPKPLVALVGTIFHNVLDEWSRGTPSTVKLEAKHYSKAYKAILDSVEIVDGNLHYGPLLRQRLTAWAGFGESVNRSRGPADAPVNIYLNLCPPAGQAHLVFAFLRFTPVLLIITLTILSIL